MLALAIDLVILPLVMIADLIAAGDHEGWTALIKAAIPVTCGQAIEVPERMLNCLSATAGDQDASMFSPGAVISGYKSRKTSLFYINYQGRAQKCGTNKLENQ